MKVVNKLESYPTGDMLVPYCPNCNNPTYSERKCPFCNTELEYEEIIEMQLEIERLNNKLKDIKSQLDYLETYSSKEDVFEDMKRRLDRIDKIIGSDKDD